MNRSHEYAEILLQKAREDIYVLKKLVDDPQSPLWTMGFHAQQAVEKSLKAVLSYRGFEFPRTHNLSYLADLLSEKGIILPTDQALLSSLNPFGAALRYDFLPEVDNNFLEPHAMFETAQSILSWAEKILSAE